MIDDGRMLVKAGRDVREMLRARPDDMRARWLGWMKVENGGDPCPAVAFDSAVDGWLELGAPEPVCGRAICLVCEDETVDVTVDDGSYTCTSCDITYGETWRTGAARGRLRGYERFAEPELGGNRANWHDRPLPAWADPSGPPSDR